MVDTLNSKKEKDLKSENVSVREKAADELALVGDTSSVQALIHSLKNDPESGVRRRVAMALGRIGSEEAIESLFEAAVNDSDDETRKNAAISLSKFGDFRAIIPLYRFYSAPRRNNFFDNIDRARVNVALTELAQMKGFAEIEELIEWYKTQTKEEDWQ